MNNKKLAVIILGNRNSGKSSMFYEFLGRRVKTGYKNFKLNSEELKPFVKNSSFEETGQTINVKFFIKNTSFEECNNKVKDYFDENNLPKIVFCAVQYVKKGIDTIKYFREQGYYLYTQWLNPGFKDDQEYEDFLKIGENFSTFGEFHKVSGKEKVNRVIEIKHFLLSWILANK